MCVYTYMDCKFMIQLVLCICSLVSVCICVANSHYTFIWKSNQVEHVWCRLLKYDDAAEAHCYVVDIGRTDHSRYVAESLAIDAGHFGHVGLCQLCTKL